MIGLKLLPLRTLRLRSFACFGFSLPFKRKDRKGVAKTAKTRSVPAASAVRFFLIREFVAIRLETAKRIQPFPDHSV